MRDQAKVLQDKLKTVVVSVVEYDGKIQLTMNGNQEILSLTIAPEILTPANNAKIEQALKNLFTQAKDKTQKEAAMLLQREGGLPNL